MKHIESIEPLEAEDTIGCTVCGVSRDDPLWNDECPGPPKPYCKRCGGREQVVNTDAGPFCRHCYPAYKAGMMAPQEVEIPPELQDGEWSGGSDNTSTVSETGGFVPPPRPIPKKMSWEWNWPRICWDWPTFSIFDFEIAYNRTGDHSPGVSVLLMILGVKLLDFEYSNEYHFDDVDFDYDKFLESVQAAQEAGVSPNVVVCEDERAAEALMLSIQVLEAPEYDVKKEIDTALARALCERLGYWEMGEERIARIVADVNKIQEEQPLFTASLAFAYAVQMEIDMWGDPRYEGTGPVGILSPEGLFDMGAAPRRDERYNPECYYCRNYPDIPEHEHQKLVPIATKGSHE